MIYLIICFFLLSYIYCISKNREKLLHTKGKLRLNKNLFQHLVVTSLLSISLMYSFEFFSYIFAKKTAANYYNPLTIHRMEFPLILLLVVISLFTTRFLFLAIGRTNIVTRTNIEPETKFNLYLLYPTLFLVSCTILIQAKYVSIYLKNDKVIIYSFKKYHFTPSFTQKKKIYLKQKKKNICIQTDKEIITCMDSERNFTSLQSFINKNKGPTKMK